MSQPFAQVFPNVNAINWAKKEFQKGIPKFQQTRKKLKGIKEREREGEREMEKETSSSMKNGKKC